MSGLSRRLLAACVLLGLGAVCSAQNDTKKEAGRNPKVDSRSAKKGEAKQSQRDLNNSQSGILYGDDFAYTISAPKGWIMDDETARTSGLSVVFYRKGETWVKGKAVMYVNVLGRKQGATAKKAIANDIAEFKERNPKIKITQDKTLQTGDRRNAVTYVFSHVDDKTSDERVSYVEMPTVVLLIALTSQTSKDYKNAVADHTALVQSIGYLGVDKGGKGDKKVMQTSVPLSVKCSIEGWFGKGYSWNLEVGPDGAAKLLIKRYPRVKQRRFTVTAAQFAELDKAVDAEHYFELRSKYGGVVPDGSTRTLTIQRGDQSKTVTLNYLRVEDPQLPEIKRAVRVWNIIRKWFSDAEAVDLRPYDRRLLNAPAQS